jgi:ParB family chromosome partitioning protein
LNPPVQSIRLDLIDVGERLRAVDQDYVAMIAESLQERGLDTPIIVTAPDADGRHRLIAGGHRVAAAQMAGWTEIAAKVVEADDLQARLIEIDENLVRRELSALDRAVFLAERKRIYEALNPATRHGGRRDKGKSTSLSTWSGRFSKATAVKLGVDERTIQRAVARAAIAPEVRALIATLPVADSGAELDKLAALAPDLQFEVARRLDASCRTIASALEAIRGAPRASARAEAERQYSTLLGAWRKAGKAARRRFVDYLVAEGEVSNTPPEAA